MPTADTNSIFSRVITRRDVALAVVATLQEWVPTYVAELERQAQLPPGTVPTPPDTTLSYRVGLDFETWMPAWSPVYIVVAQAIGLPERVGVEGSYIQVFEVRVGCNFQYDGNLAMSLGDIEEDSAIQYADILGMAACTALLQHGGMGAWPDGSTVSTKTVLSQYPLTSFPYPSEERARRVCRSTFTLQAVVTDVVTEIAGPATPPGNPYSSPGDLPTVTDVTADGVWLSPGGAVSVGPGPSTLGVEFSPGQGGPNDTLPGSSGTVSAG